MSADIINLADARQRQAVEHEEREAGRPIAELLSDPDALGNTDRGLALYCGRGRGGGVECCR